MPLGADNCLPTKTSKSRYFTVIGSSSVKTVADMINTDMLLIMLIMQLRPAVELFEGIIVDER